MSPRKKLEHNITLRPNPLLQKLHKILVMACSQINKKNLSSLNMLHSPIANFCPISFTQIGNLLLKLILCAKLSTYKKIDKRSIFLSSIVTQSLCTFSLEVNPSKLKPVCISESKSFLISTLKPSILHQLTNKSAIW